MTSTGLSKTAPGFPVVTGASVAFLEALELAGFRGDLAHDLATRITFATDNSIYQIPPQAVIFPRNGDDIGLAMRVANQPEFKQLTFFPRGGGTGCNGQSLGDGIIVDTSRHMRGILDFDAVNQLVKVEPGVIRDQLIAFLKPHGFFFPPHVSTSSRATIGGMVSNDSSGKGSRIYGKTANHVEALEVVLPDGREFEFRAQMGGPLADSEGAAGTLHRAVAAVIEPLRLEIKRVFPDLARGFTGYNLRHARSADGAVSLPQLIAGSEGTLCLIKSITCRVTRIPKHTAVVAVRYASLDAGLRAVPGLLTANPSAIEFIDNKILSMAEKSAFWEKAQAILGGAAGEAPARAMQFVEFEAESAEALATQIADLELHLAAIAGQAGAPLGWRNVTKSDQIKAIWDMRKACQGLLLAQQTEKRAVPFIEDFVVPPERLADFIGELTDVLSARGVDVGMFGHADVGVVHMRPLLDMTKADDRQLIREISDKVFELTQAYGGLLWGEHGKGFRSEYSEAMLGPELTQAMAAIKTLFDPQNRLNPGKIAAPLGSGSSVVALDAVPMRGEYDQMISASLAAAFPKATHCNGNGACFALDSAAPICPSYKATGDRRFSPKGRAGLLREWLRLRSIGDEERLEAITPVVHNALDNCLACKSCSGGSCPVKIDIPEMKAHFAQWYYSRRRRPLADHLVRRLEGALPLLAAISPIVNRLQSLAPAKAFARNVLGYIDLPRLSGRRFRDGLKDLSVAQLSAREIIALPAASRETLVVVVQDGFTSFYEAEVALAQIALIQRLGYRAVVLNYRPGGKPLHVKGFLSRFHELAHRNATDFAALARSGLSMVGLDAATTLIYRHEYASVNRDHEQYLVQLLSEWLGSIDLPELKTSGTYKLIQHCTEKSLHPETTGQWVSIFRKTGLSVDIVDAGCCGMAGLFGHEAANQTISLTLYDQTWRDIVESTDQGKFMATGYSCRSQVKRFSGVRARHPAEVLLAAISSIDTRSRPPVSS